MIPYQNFEIYASFTLYFIVKIVSEVAKKYRVSMYDKKGNLTSIPEKNEVEDEMVKWVPKKKHEVLKAKYKCLKKLFQIYDASVIGILPQNYPETYQEEERSHRRKRSHRTKTDASAGTNEASSGDISLSTTEQTAATAVIKDLDLQTFSTDISKTTITKVNDKTDKSTQDSKEDITSVKESECVQTFEPQPLPYIVINERRRPTRFQSFLYRIFGLKPEKRYGYSPTRHVYAASDNNILNRYERRRRRGLRFRRRRPKKIHSEVALRGMNSPVILSYVQSVQKSCLMDTTPRQCPILGCRMLFYGIINYNDHLNLCHFPDREHICHYCHAGFSREYDKIVHENEHIGITRITSNLPPSPIPCRQSAKIASNTQTEPENSKIDVPEEKLKKIVSFFDKISDPNQVYDRIKKNGHSESNLESLQRSSKSDSTETEDTKSSRSEKSGKSMSSATVQKSGRNWESSANSDVTSSFPSGHRVTCRFCGENFKFRRQLSLHVDLEHRAHDKFSKFHSCPGILTQKTTDLVSEDGTINVQSIGAVASSTYTEVSKRPSNLTVSCDPSTNIVYYTSAESVVKKLSVVGSFVQKIRSYKWEPGTKVIRV